MTRHIEVDLLYVHESQLEAYKDEDILRQNMFLNPEKSGIRFYLLCASECSSWFKTAI